MKYLALLLTSFILSPISFAKADKVTSKRHYFDQEVPKLEAKLFAPGIVSISGRYEYAMTFSPDLSEMYFSAQEDGDVAAIYSSKQNNGVWQPLEKLRLTEGEKAGEMQAFITRDNQKLFFTAYNSDFTDTKIWVAQRNGNAWGKAEKLLSPANDAEVFYSTLAQNGDLFYTDIFKSQVYVSKLVDGKYSSTQPVTIPFGIHPFISPAQDFLLVDAKSSEENRKDSDIYAYFKKSDGSWSEPVRLGDEVNTRYSETVPSVTPDGKYLFFSRYDDVGGTSNFYWISTKVISDLKRNVAL